MKKKKAKENPIPEAELLALMTAQEEALEEESDQVEEAEEESLSPEAKMQADITLFHSLFPDVKAQDIPKEVWDSVEEGESLAASYSLYAVKTFREEERIRKVNEENDKKAAPRVQSDPGGEEYFSPEAVKQMTRAEIRKNYNKILTSMEKWN